MDPVEIKVLLPTLAVVLGIAFLLGRVGRGRLAARVAYLEGELARTEAQAREQGRMAAQHRAEQQNHAKIVRALPNAVHALNRSDLDSKEIPRLLCELAQTIFDPEQILVFLVPSPGEETDRPQELLLKEKRGLGEIPEGARRIRVGEGKIGWVAENKHEMVSEDWLNPTRTDGRHIGANHPDFRLDIVGPLVLRHEDRDLLLGILCIGAPRTRPRDEKLMLQMITNLGSIAIMNTHNVSRLQEQANHDGLTGLLNKRFFMNVKLGMLINAAEKGAQPLAVFIFDIDHFKTYNDTNGHMEGDEILRSVARLVRENIRPGDAACRYGGEEFVVAMPQADAKAALEVAERVRLVIESHPFQHRERQPGGRVAISGGVAVFPVDGTGGNDLVRNADQALYEAKRAGRNRVMLFRGVSIGDAADVDSQALAPASGPAEG